MQIEFSVILCPCRPHCYFDILIYTFKSGCFCHVRNVFCGIHIGEISQCWSVHYLEAVVEVVE